MKEVTIHMASGKPDDIHIDANPSVPIEAFLLLTKTRGQEYGHMLVFGDATTAGRMIVNLFRWAIHRDPESAYTLARAAEDILAIEKSARGAPMLVDQGGPDTVQ